MAWYWWLLIVILIVGAITGIILAVVLIKKVEENISFGYGTSSSYSFPKDVAITPLSPNYSFDSYEVDPLTPLPTGLTLNKTTGVISGTPTAVTASKTYNIIGTSTNKSGNGVVTIEIV
jgi:hypothetical protein